MTSLDTNITAAVDESTNMRDSGQPLVRKDIDVMAGENQVILEKEFSRDRARAYVIRCDGEHAIIAAEIEQGSTVKENYWSVGQLISIKVGKNRVVGIACSVEVPDQDWKMEDTNEVHVTIELVGEIVATQEGKEDKFSSGIASYPQMGCIAHRIRGDDLAIIYKTEGDTVVKVGQLTQDQSIDAKIEIDMLLSRHFAVVGTTGVGKSTSVTLILRKVIKARPDIRILMLDPHNEFASAFPNDSVVVDSSNLILPFWLFKLEEFSEVVFRGQTGFDAELEILRDLIPLAKERYREDAEKNNSSLMKKKKSKSNLTADMPVPYRMVDLLKLIDERLGMLEGKSDKPILKSLEYRLQSISDDPRFRFMFDQSNGKGGDIMEEIISKIFRVPHNGKPICVLEMSGLPTEVVNSVVSILSRMAFEIAMNSDGGIQTLVVCEEAHRYIPADPNAGFWPTRQSIARIAKEGRKYGVFLCIITQRPGELDPTILSQCNTLFAMRLGNQKDQEIIRGAVSNGAKSTISFLSSIANRECIAFGEAIQTPMRMTFETMRPEDLPGAHIYEQQQKVKDGLTVSLNSVLRRMRNEDRKPSAAQEESYAGTDNAAAAAQAAQAPATGTGANPGNEINAVLNSAYVSANNSLTPQQTPPMAPRQAAPAQPAIRQPAPAAPAPVTSAPKPSSRAGSLINSFRGK